MNRIHTETCPECQGKGWVEYGWLICGNCRGTGIVATTPSPDRNHAHDNLDWLADDGCPHHE